MGIEVKVIKDSIAKNKVRIVTLQLKFHRYVLAEFNTHRVFSRNASSSRAIPVKTMLKQVWNDPAMPLRLGSNKPGMQSGESLDGWRASVATTLWKSAAKAACIFAWGMMKVGLHKQWANRVLEPWQYIHVIVTSTEWDNFFSLRIHEDAQPEIAYLAKLMQSAITDSVPQLLSDAEWHLPYVTSREAGLYPIDVLCKLASARCCRVSYLKHDGSSPPVSDDITLYDRLVGSEPLHASPLEHIATPLADANAWTGNLRGWFQYRKHVEQHFKEKHVNN